MLKCMKKHENYSEDGVAPKEIYHWQLFALVGKIGFIHSLIPLIPQFSANFISLSLSPIIKQWECSISG